jgi:hypothetical protein
MRPLKQFCKSALLLTGCMTAPLFLISGAFADNTALVSFDTSQYLSHSNYDDAGYIFTNSNPLLITSLGLYTQSTSLAQSHQLSLYTTSGTLLTSTSVGVGVAPDAQGFVYAPLASNYLLNPGTYFVAAYYAQGSPDLFLAGGGPVTMGPDLTFEDQFLYYNPSTGFDPNSPAGQFTFGSSTNSSKFIGPNFVYTVASADTPEPGSIAMLVTGGLTGAAFLKRRKRAAR